MGYFFTKNSLDVGQIFLKKILRRGSHFTKIAKKSNIIRFWGRKTLRNGSRFGKVLKKNLSNQLFYEGRKSLDMDRGFRPRAAHHCQKIIWVPILWQESQDLMKYLFTWEILCQRVSIQAPVEFQSSSHYNLFSTELSKMKLEFSMQYFHLLFVLRNWISNNLVHVDMISKQAISWYWNQNTTWTQL